MSPNNWEVFNVACIKYYDTIGPFPFLPFLIYCHTSQDFLTNNRGTTPIHKYNNGHCEQSNRARSWTAHTQKILARHNLRRIRFIITVSYATNERVSQAQRNQGHIVKIPVVWRMRARSRRAGGRQWDQLMYPPRMRILLRGYPAGTAPHCCSPSAHIPCRGEPPEWQLQGTRCRAYFNGLHTILLRNCS